MAEKKKIRIKAAKDAPELVAHGNLEAVNEKGYFTTTDRLFADHIIRSGFGKEVEAKASRPRPKKAKSATKKAAKRATPEPAAAEEHTEGGTE